MTTDKLFQLFKNNNTRSANGVNRNSQFLSTYGDISLEEAFTIYLSKMNVMVLRQEKIKKFESFLANSNAEFEQSKKSESKYYILNGCKYRFSGHIYPTGSMTNIEMGIYDLAANPELIDNINF